MPAATTLLVIVVAGLAAQWIASRLRLPGILLMIGTGIVLGPVTGVVQIDIEQAELTELIGLGVAIILFEGALDLRLAEFRRVGSGVRRLTVVGAPLAWGLGALAAHHVGGLEWPTAWVLGAILVVTGPTVILPLLRQERLGKTTGSLLKWEGIVNDPIGVLLAVLTFQYFTLADGGLPDAALGLGKAIVAAAVLGGGVGYAVAQVFRRGWVSAHLKAPLLMVIVLSVFWGSNQIQHEAGLLAVTVMGVVVGNSKLVERARILHFKSSLTVVLLAILFIVIPTQLTLDDVRALDWRAAAFVAIVLFVVRPATVWLSTIGAGVSWRDRLLLGWIAPRGIVAAATAGVFGPALVLAGYSDAVALLPIVFAVIVVTVLLHGFTLGPLARRLGLAAGARNGMLIIGSSPFALQLSKALTKADVPVLVADGSYQRSEPLRRAGVDVWAGEILTEHGEHDLDTSHLSHALAATENDYYNAIVARSQTAAFGSNRSLQLAMQPEDRDLPIERRGHVAFDSTVDFHEIHARLDAGWTVRGVTVTSAGWEEDAAALGTPESDWMLLAAVTGSGALRVHSPAHPTAPRPEWTAIVFVAPTS